MLRNKSMVVGSTGLVGRSVVNHLIKKEISVLALVRNDQISSHSLLNYYKIDFDSISIHRPGLLIGARNEIRLGEFIGQKIFPYFIDPFLIGSTRKYRSIKGDILAKAMVNLSGYGEGVNYYYFDDFNKSAKGNS